MEYGNKKYSSWVVWRAVQSTQPAKLRSTANASSRAPTLRHSN
jgi:hypothetical protein